MADRSSKITFALSTIPHYDGNPNKLSPFINAVNTIQNLFATLQPPLDNFDKSIAFLSIKSKIVGKALESIKDLEFNNWTDLSEYLINNFKDKSTTVTIINDILKLNNIKNPYKLFEIIKEKFLMFKSSLSVEENDNNKRLAISQFAEKLIITHFITTISDPHRNNIATRNPKSLNEVEALLNNDFQYLKYAQTPVHKPIQNRLPNIPPMKFPGNTFPTGPINFQNKSNQNKPFVPRQQIRNAQGIKPTPMSVQTHQTYTPKQNYTGPKNQTNYFRPTGNNPNYTVEELFYNENNDDLNLDIPESAIDYESYDTNIDYNEQCGSKELENTEEATISDNFLECQGLNVNSKT